MNDNLASLAPAGHWKVWILYRQEFTCIGIVSQNRLAHALANNLPEDHPEWQAVVTRAEVTFMNVVEEEPEVDTSTFANHDGTFADND